MQIAASLYPMFNDVARAVLYSSNRLPGCERAAHVESCGERSSHGDDL